MKVFTGLHSMRRVIMMRALGNLCLALRRCVPTWSRLHLVALLLAGCAAAPPPIHSGTLPKIQQLKNLTWHESTISDVISALGPPRGYGRMRHAPTQPIRSILVYEYVRVKGDQNEVSMLLVYIDKDQYDGYLWFSVQELLDSMKR